MTLTELTKNLWKFWGGLNEGKIYWELLDNEEISPDERDKAREMVVSRGFVNVVYMDKFPKSNSNNWKVVCGGNMNPCYFGKRWYFTDRKYARDYVSYLMGKNKINQGYSIVEV